MNCRKNYYYRSFLMTIGFALACTLIVKSALASMIELTLSNPPVIGQSVIVDVSITGAFDSAGPFEQFLGFGFDVSVGDNSVVAYAGAMVAAPFQDVSAAFTNTDVAGVVFPGIENNGLNDTIFLGSLVFDALGIGQTDIVLSGDSLGLNEGLVFLLGNTLDIAASLSVNISPIPINEPPLLLLLASGLILLVHKLRK